MMAASWGIQSAPSLDGATHGGRHALPPPAIRPRSRPMFYRPDQPDAPRAGNLSTRWCCRDRSAGSRRSTVPGRANLAPYSFFNAVAYRPPQVMFSATGPHDHGGLKDSVANIEATASSWSTSPPGSCARRSTPARSAPRTATTSSRMPVWPRRRPRLVKPPRVAREPGPPRMRAVADRRARIARRPTGPTAWSSAASSASTSPIG